MHASLALVFVTMAMTLAWAQAEDVAEPRGAKPQQAVLVLALEDFTRPWVRSIFEGFSGSVTATSDAPVIYFEALDASRFEDRAYLGDLRQWLARKYRSTRIDLVVPLGEDALGFLVEMRGEPWPTAQVLYFEVGSVRFDTEQALPQAGGMLLDDHSVEALRTIKSILPDVKHLALMQGASAIELMRWRSFSDRVKQAELEPIQLTGLSLDETLVAVRQLPPQTAVLTLAPIVDAKGRVLSPERACELISAASNAPTFSMGAHDFGCGVVGGLMRDWTIAGRLLGDEALQRLMRPSTDVVRVPASRYTTLAFDERQLRRWNISERILPAGAVVRFRVPNVWRDYRGLVLTALGVTLVQSLLIAGLVFEHRRRRRAEIEARRHLTAMAHLDRRAAMGELATSLAHELNQPLNAILQNAGVAQILLASNGVPPSLGEMTDIISDIRKDDIRASEIIRRMRSLLQKHEVESHSLDLNEVVVETVAIVRPDVKSREIQLDLDLTDGMRPVMGDRVHLQQVLLNLLMNAMDAVTSLPTERRRVRVSTTQSDDEVRLSVTDTGEGIPADKLAEIFEPFYSTKSEGSGMGMGMGLAIARNIVEAHGGRMAAENNHGGGATVWFAIPPASRGQPDGQSNVTKVL